MHLNVVEDYSGGCTVCINCGLVLDTILYTNDYDRTQCEDGFADQTKIKKSEIKKPNYYNFIKDICNKMQAECFISLICCKFDTLSKKHSKTNQMILASYCIYRIFKEQQSGKSIKDVSLSTGIAISKLSNCEKECDFSYPSQARDLISANSKILGMSGRDANKILDGLIKLEKIVERKHFSPLSKAATIIYMYARFADYKNVNVKKMVRQLHISKMAIYRCKKFVHNKLLQKKLSLF